MTDTGRKAMQYGNTVVILMVILVAICGVGLAGLAVYCLNKSIDQSEG
jgi:hypothetical protein